MPPGPRYRTTQAKIDRLRRRLDEIERGREQDKQFVAVLQGLLDLIADLDAEQRE